MTTVLSSVGVLLLAMGTAGFGAWCIRLGMMAIHDPKAVRWPWGRTYAEWESLYQNRGREIPSWTLPLYVVTGFVMTVLGGGLVIIAIVIAVDGLRGR